MNEHSLVMWNQTYGATSTDFAHSLVETSDGGYALAGSITPFGGRRSNFWLVKTEPMAISQSYHFPLNTNWTFFEK